MIYTKKHLNEASSIIKNLDIKIIENIVHLLAKIKSSGGRIFF